MDGAYYIINFVMSSLLGGGGLGVRRGVGGGGGGGGWGVGGGWGSWVGGGGSGGGGGGLQLDVAHPRRAQLTGAYINMKSVE